MAERKAHVERNTSETKIIVDLNLDGSGKYDIDTGIGFFDHMLNSFAKHGFFDLTCKVDGDLEVDCHHTIEILESYWDRLSVKRWEIKREFAVSETSFFQWTRLLYLVR